ncbi:MAG TPA: hypothetical protein VK525_06700 [Candidatus Saccharimonadales bacterium]|nr:hypothetical protein [Candidatus Saccharimonadales bacterium]
MPRAQHMHGRLQVAGTLIILGLAVEAACLLSSRPIAFVILASFGSLLISAGVLLFLYALVFLESGNRGGSGPGAPPPRASL